MRIFIIFMWINIYQTMSILLNLNVFMHVIVSIDEYTIYLIP
jgi:hypothetical protein